MGEIDPRATCFAWETCGCSGTEAQRSVKCACRTCGRDVYTKREVHDQHTFDSKKEEAALAKRAAGARQPSGPGGCAGWIVFGGCRLLAVEC